MHAPTLSQVELSAKAKEAELNARMLSLESQIHWLTEQNKQLTIQTAAASGQQGAGGPSSVTAAPAEAMTTAAAAAVSAKEVEELRGSCTALEADLRKTKRAEQKLQALLFR